MCSSIEGSGASLLLQELIMTKEEEEELGAVPSFVTLVTSGIFFSLFISSPPCLSCRVAGAAVISAHHKIALGSKTLVCKFVQCPSVDCAVHLHTTGVVHG